MILHGFFRSSAAHRIRIALNLKGIPWKLAPVHLRRGDQRSDDYLRLNPQGLVPAVEVDGHVLTQSMAIVEWLEETSPEPPLLPADFFARARARAFAQVIACDIHPLQNLRVLRQLKRSLGQDQDGLDAWCRHWVGEGLGACERLLSREPHTVFAFGNTPGIAEVFLVPQLHAAERFGVDLTTMPRLREVREACDRLPAFEAAEPARQPDFEP